MKKLALILIIALTLTGCAVTDAGTPAPVEQETQEATAAAVTEEPEKPAELTDAQIEELKKSCTTIYADFGNNWSQGTAVAIGNYEYLTAYHAAKENFTNIRTTDDVKLTLDTFDASLDIARLTSSEEAIPVKIGDVSDSRVGDEVVIIGSPKGKDDTVIHAKIKKIVGAIIFDGLLPPGSSGSGVFNMQGELIGIVIGVNDEKDDTGAVTINNINNTL